MSGLLSSLGDVLNLDVNNLLGLDANLDIKGTKDEKRSLMVRGFHDFRDSVVMARDLVERDIQTINVPDNELHDILDKLKALEDQVNGLMGSIHSGSDDTPTVEVPHSTPGKTDQGSAVDPPKAPTNMAPAARPETHKKITQQKAAMPAGAGAFKEKIAMEDNEESDGESDDELETQTLTSTKESTSTTTKTRTHTTTVTVPGQARIAPVVPTPEPAPTLAPETENAPPADPAQGGVTIGGFDGSGASGAPPPAASSPAPETPASSPIVPPAPVAAAKIKEDHPDTKKNQKLESEEPETGGLDLAPSADLTSVSISAPSISVPAPVGPPTPVSVVPTPKSFPGHKVSGIPAIDPVETPVSAPVSIPVANKVVASSSAVAPSGFSTVTLPSATPLSR